jgi:hypothetical protein
MSFSPNVLDFLGGVVVALDPVQRFRAVIGEPDPWQTSLLRTHPMRNEQDQLVLTLVGRQSGKSTTCGCLAYDDFTRGKTVVLTAPSMRQSTELFRRVLAFKHADPFCPPIVRQTQTELEAHPRHGGRIVAVPASNESRGLTADTILADETCFIDDDSLLSFWPMRKSGGRILCLTTPNGTRTGYFYDTFESDANVRRIKAVSTETTRPERLAQIEFDRRTMPDHKFRREHLCEWVGSGESLLSWKVLERAMNNVEEALCLT